MNFTDFPTLLAAWLLVPVVVTLASAGLGSGLAVATGRRLGALTVPLGYLGGAVLITLLLQLGLSGVLSVVLAVLVAAAGGAVRWLRRERLAPGIPADWLPAAAAGLGAYLVAMAPLIAAGRITILGYVLNNDPSVHISTVEFLHDHGAHTIDPPGSSFESVSSQLTGGYPLGSYAWPLLARVIPGVDAFSTWTPLIALTLALSAVVLFVLLRQVGANRTVAAIGGAAIACGYLPYSYYAQGSAKEIEVLLAVYTVPALAALMLRSRPALRAYLPAGLAIASSVVLFGLAGLTFILPVAAILAVVILVRAPAAQRVRTALVLVGTGALTALVALPFLTASAKFAQSNEHAIVDPNQTGNLLGPVPWHEALNVWLARDYRIDPSEYPGLTSALLVLAAALGVIGVLYALRTRRFGIPLALVGAVVGTLFIASRYAIYFDAKAYTILAPALGAATVAGVVALMATRHRLLTVLGATLGAVLVLGVLASAALVYAGAWTTPKERFAELDQIADRFDGQGPILVNEREQYAWYFLRGVTPWESWGAWQPSRGLAGRDIPPGLPWTPDFDDYTMEHVSRFKLLLERKRPGGSLPPGNFKPVFETPHYRVWRRVGPMPQEHLALGAGAITGTDRFTCEADPARALLARARSEHASLRVAHGPDKTVTMAANEWLYYNMGLGPVPGFLRGRNGYAVLYPQLKRGRYVAYVQGSFAGGERLFIGSQPIGSASGDLGLPDAWQRLGSVTVARATPMFVMAGLREPFWEPGSRQSELVGPLAFVPENQSPRVAEVEPADFKTLCGKQLDWVELP